MSFQKSHKPPWWKSSLVYQIYPASFLSKDPSPACNKDAMVGNLRGIISKIPYIASLGFDCLWLSPIFASPQKDMGYDISDYRNIHPPYGTVEDVQELIDTLHSTIVPESEITLEGQGRKMRLLMDLVVNHTSDQHAWFIESRSSRTNSKSDWYFWRDGKTDSAGIRVEPNNWRSIFGGSAWHWVESRQQYYLALFLPEQPDLNWEIPEMRQATYDDMRFWLDRGVDGFRIDSMNLMSKHTDLPDAPIIEPDEKYQNAGMWYASGPKMHDYLQEMTKEVFSHYDIFTVGELGSSETEESVSKYVAPERKELNCVFHGMDLDFGPGGKYTGGNEFTVKKLRDVTRKWQVGMPKFDGWNTVYLDNHDSGRSLSRYASDEPQHRANAAKLLAVYLCTLSGTPFVLSGQEIGMANLGKDLGIEYYIDVEGKNWYEKVLHDRGAGADMSDVMKELQLKARDHGRLPMQWTSEENAGFCDSHENPWMTINPDHKQWNAASQIGKVGTVFDFWRRIIALRKQCQDILVYGSTEILDELETSEQVIGYERSSENQKVAVLLNVSKEVVSLSGSKYTGWKTLISNMEDPAVKDLEITLRAYEAIVLANN